MQILIVISSLFYSLGVGFTAGSSMMISVIYLRSPQDAENKEDAASTSEFSHFIYQYMILASGFSFLIVAVVIQIFGRKAAHIILNCSLIISVILSSVAYYIYLPYLVQIVQSVSKTGIIVQAMIISEYCHKKRRGIFMCLNKFAEYIGHIISSLLVAWIEPLCLIGLVPPCVAIILTIFWPESPYFHASNAHYEECEKSFKLLHGESEEKQRELHSIIAVQQKKMDQSQHYDSVIENIFTKLLDRNFWKVFLIMTTVTGLYLVVELSNDFDIIYTSFRHYKYPNQRMTFSGITRIISPLVSCAFILIERRTLLLVFGSISIPIMFLESFFASSSNEWIQFVLCLLITCHCFFVNVSIAPVCAILFGELYFLEHRGIGTFASGIVWVVLKLISSFTTHMAHDSPSYSIYFIILACTTAFCLFIVLFFLPETKDKTLQEIEFDIRGQKAVIEATAQNVEMGELFSGEGNEDNLNKV